MSRLNVTGTDDEVVFVTAVLAVRVKERTGDAQETAEQAVYQLAGMGDEVVIAKAQPINSFYCHHPSRAEAQFEDFADLIANKMVGRFAPFGEG